MQDFTACTNKQPNAENCFVCGRSNTSGLKMQFFDDGIDTIISTIALDKRFEGYPGIVHGGILATMLDEVVGRCAMIKDHHHFMMTVTLDVKYRLPVPIGEKIRIVGTSTRMKGRIGKARGEILLADGRVACESEMVLSTMPEHLASEDRSNDLGWRID